MVDAAFPDNRVEDNILRSVVSELEAREKDLTVAAHLGKSLLEANEVLRKENNEMLETFRQKIYELENERNLLKLRLDTVESDYDHQIKELQTDIVSMRLDVQKQRQMYQQLEIEKNLAVNDLTQQNQNLSKKLQESSENEARMKAELKTIRAQCAQRKTSIQDHFHILDSLRLEITSLREEKVKLELKLAAITEERDNLVITLADSYKQIDVMEQIQSDQMATISSQDVVIANLQARATTLQENIKSLTVKQNTTEESSSPSHKAEVRPHHSLLAELAEQRLELLGDVNFQFPNGSRLGDDDDDEVEMDDYALLAYLKAIPNNEAMERSLIKPQTESAVLLDPKDTLIGELRDEIGDIYQQMRQMCVEVQALGNAQTMSTREGFPKGGTHTPDELAMVEMDFRLSSLKSVLGDLRGLLRELVMETDPDFSVVPRRPTSQSPTSGDPHDSTYVLVESDIMREPCATDIHKTQTYSDEHKAMLKERDALASEVAAAQRQLSSLQNERGNQCVKRTGTNFVANWQELDDDDYEFELPR